MKRGLTRLVEAGCELVFVLGYPEYHPRFGFQPAGRLGFSAPYPILKKNSGAWMVLDYIGQIHNSIGMATRTIKTSNGRPMRQ